ncbi:MAG: phosphoribosylformylglycinamidine synthase subunit PurQ [Thermoplasmata archaeon]|nr:MAG: phosphoribosylformylglycinamidine synthase subunit PurQ [Thermoplasmata archaeon]
MGKPNALVLTGYGLNCDEETHYALSLAGADAKKVHINELIKGKELGSEESLDNYHIMVFIGGFCWADDHGAGVLWSARFRYNIWDQLEAFINRGGLIIGICNGFQALANLGLLPGFDRNYSARRIALLNNDSGNFRDDWTTCKANPKSPCIFTKGIHLIDMPIRHGEGKLFTDPKTLARLKKEGLIALQYSRKDGGEAQGEYPFNPNGSMEDIAGICDPSGRIFGLMPHPEAFNHPANHPDWTYQKEEAKRRGHVLEEREGLGIRIFRNAVDFARENLVIG